VEVGVPMCLKIFSNWSSSFCPLKSGFPFYISAMMQPMLQMSTDVN